MFRSLELWAVIVCILVESVLSKNKQLQLLSWCVQFVITFVRILSKHLEYDLLYLFHMYFNKINKKTKGHFMSVFVCEGKFTADKNHCLTFNLLKVSWSITTTFLASTDSVSNCIFLIEGLFHQLNQVFCPNFQVKRFSSCVQLSFSTLYHQAC